MFRRIGIGIAVCIALFLNLALLWRQFKSRNDSLPPGMVATPIVSAHQKRVDARIASIRQLSFEDLSAALDDEWVLTNSGVYGEGLVTIDSGHDFGLLLGCRLRRRFIQELEKRPLDDRRAGAREVHSQWLSIQDRRYEDRVEWIKNPSGDMKLFPVLGTKLAVCVGLFCCARWNSIAETRGLLSKSRAFERRLTEQLPAITDDEVVLSVMPTSVVPDLSCQISILAYAARRDPKIDRKVITDMEAALALYEQKGAIERFEIPWQHWDCDVDIFDVTAPANTFHKRIAPAIDDESITWYRLRTFNKTKAASILQSIEALLPQ